MKGIALVLASFVSASLALGSGGLNKTSGSAAFSFPITVSDGAGGTQVLMIGVDPNATDGIDPALGETERPPTPPAGIFDARLIGDDISITGFGQGVLEDYRQGTVNLSGSRIHETKYQVGTGTEITIHWDLPTWATGQLQDFFGGVIVNESMSGSGSYVVSSPGTLNKLKITITYHPPLPVQLADFHLVSLTTEAAYLGWRTLSETNNYGFFVQRKTGPNPSFDDLPDAFIPGKGTTLEHHDYIFADKTITTGVTYVYRLRQVDLDGTVSYSESIIVNTSVAGIRESATIDFRLLQNYPNPFNPSTTIGYTLPEPSHVRLVVLNLLGQEVAELVNGEIAAGYHEVRFVASSMASGAYLYRIQIGDFTQIKTLVFEK